MRPGPFPLTIKGSPDENGPKTLTMEDVKKRGYLDDPELLAAMDLAHKVQAEKLNKEHGTDINPNDYGIKQAVRHELHHDILADKNAEIQKRVIDLAIEKTKRGDIG